MKNNYRPYGKSGTRKQQFVLFYNEMLNSPAYRSLSCPAKCALITLKQRFTGYNNGEISLSCRECASLNKMSRNTAQRALKELIEKGFVELMQVGWFGTRQASVYRLTMEANIKSNDRPTNEWKNWGKGVPKDAHPIPKESQRSPNNKTET